MQRVGGWCEPIRACGYFPFSESTDVTNVGGRALYSAETLIRFESGVFINAIRVVPRSFPSLIKPYSCCFRALFLVFKGDGMLFCFCKNEWRII